MAEEQGGQRKDILVCMKSPCLLLPFSHLRDKTLSQVSGPSSHFSGTKKDMLNHILSTFKMLCREEPCSVTKILDTGDYNSTTHVLEKVGCKEKNNG